MKRKVLILAVLPILLALLSSPRVIATCNATQNCSNGSTVNCSGNTSCTVGSASVTCDGVTTSCPSTYCSVSIECPYPYRPCTLWCESWTGSCSQTATSVTCNGVTKTCAGAPKNCPL